MGLSKKKIVVFLVVIALCSGMAIVYSTPSGTDKSAEPLLPDNSDSGHSTQQNLTIGSDGSLDEGGLFFKMTLMVLLVVIFGAVAIYLSKKLLPGFSQLSGKRIQVSETVHLGPRKAIHLIKVGEQTFLIGSTNENITKLANITGQFSGTNLPANPIDNS